MKLTNYEPMRFYFIYVVVNGYYLGMQPFLYDVPQVAHLGNWVLKI